MNMKKRLSILLALLVLISTPIQIFAKNVMPEVLIFETGEVKYTILEDNKELKKVKTEDSRYTYTVTYNKITRTMDTIISDSMSKTGESYIHINLDIPSESYGITENGTSLSLFDNATTRASIKQNTFSNFEYTKTIGTTNEWQLRRPDPSFPINWLYFDTKETKDNKSYLNSFMDYVEKINAQEGKVLASITASVFSDILVSLSGIATVFSGGTLTPAMVTAAAGAVGANLVMVDSMVTLGSYWKYAYNYYFEVFYRQS